MNLWPGQLAMTILEAAEAEVPSLNLKDGLNQNARFLSVQVCAKSWAQCKHSDSTIPLWSCILFTQCIGRLHRPNMILVMHAFMNVSSFVIIECLNSPCLDNGELTSKALSLQQWAVPQFLQHDVVMTAQSCHLGSVISNPGPVLRKRYVSMILWLMKLN